MIEKEELLSIIPHRGKMVLLSRVNSYNLEERSIEAEYHVTPECIFYDPEIHGIPAWAGFECIAQAISAFSGIKYKEKGEPPKLGFILAVSQLSIELPFFKDGSIISIKAKELEDLSPVYLFYGELFFDNKKVFSGKLTVYDVDDEQIKIIKRESN
jgi:predicted hotdog family 3-hydroxylacyl-ACP dehydratase